MNETVVHDHMKAWRKRSRFPLKAVMYEPANYATAPSYRTVAYETAGHPGDKLLHPARVLQEG